MLTERQLEVLLSVVCEFIESGDHVGSRTLSKRYLTGRSAATIRNEMADLEEMGYLMQPHTSAGRVPTTSAYRIFVDSVLRRRKERASGEGEWVENLKAHRDGVEGALASASELLSNLSSYVGVAAVRQLRQARLNKIDFIRLSSQSMLLLVVLEGGVVHHKVVPMEYDLSQDALEDLARRINALSGNEWGEIRAALRSYIAQELSRYTDSCRVALDELDKFLSSDRTSVFTGSLSNLFNVPDFQDIGRFRALFSILEQESAMADLLRKCDAADGLSVVIGGEKGLPELENFSLIVSSSSAAGQKTMLGVIGPKRMNYEKVISALDKVLYEISDLDESTEVE
ncbi:heat-inducible transcription repressor HrcA [Synergistales bacterium]|nr:heat-inducible transcription repressor HrcA [Synergistales bacterium]GHV54521.1 heat-inducible transcription repressor HrcA [Synergistales bacterium]